MDYLKELNEPQGLAVQATEGPVMIVAGAGSGKTRVLTYRIAHIMNKGVDAFNILALTFTNKASREMKERIAKIVGGSEAQNLWMGTFHSVFAKILRIEAEKIGFPRNFTIYDTADSKNLIKAIVKEMQLDEDNYKNGVVYNRISSAKNNLIGPDAYARNLEIISADQASKKPKIAEIFAEYDRRCFKASAMDFDDLLFKTNILLRDHADVLHKYQHKFKYILVDEYQDTNYSQYLIVKKLAALYENICVVGDDAQSIYSFRGANIQNILNFKKDYPDFKQFKLEQNYRSTQVIVNAANSIIAKNQEQIQKNVWTSNSEGSLIKVHRAHTDNDEGFFVANQIFEIKNTEQSRNKDFAILYRTNAQSRSFEEALRKLNINYRIYGGLSFYQRKEIKDLLAYFRLTANNNDEEALKRVINYPVRGIGKTTLEKVAVVANETSTSFWEVISDIEQYNTGFNSGTKTKLTEFVTMIKSYGTMLETQTAFQLGEHIAKSTGILRELYADKSPEGVSRYENIQELLNGLSEFSEKNDPNNEEKLNTLSDFLIDVALLTDADQNDEDNDKVSLMTIHASKGLEFPYVNIVGMEEKLFPSQMSFSTRSELEEERRLFYVAITRAEKRVTLSYALSRFKYGNLESCEPSRFIEEIDSKYLDLPKEKEMRSRKSFSNEDDFDSAGFGGFGGFSKSNKDTSTSRENILKKTFAPAPQPKNLVRMAKAENTYKVEPFAEGADISEIIAGVNIEHEKFGKGKVLNVEGAIPNIKATIFFPSAGQKQLLLKFAKLKIVE
jgi:DNA helicase II / ATP-dependent DNA helicase PcrA